MNKYNILIVDDEIEMRELLKDILSDLGHETTMASSADEALKIITTNKIDLLILDNQMPNKTGEELLKDIEKILDRNFKIIFATGGHKNLLQLVEDNNVYHLVDYVLNKPFSKKVLENVLDEIM